MSTVQPLGDRVLTEAINEDVEQVGGIFLPDSAKEQNSGMVKSKIVALGTGGIDKEGNKIQFHVNVGDVILTSKYGGNEYKIEGKEYKIYEQKDIIALIKK